MSIDPERHIEFPHESPPKPIRICPHCEKDLSSDNWADHTTNHELYNEVATGNPQAPKLKVYECTSPRGNWGVFSEADAENKAAEVVAANPGEFAEE